MYGRKLAAISWWNLRWTRRPAPRSLAKLEALSRWSLGLNPVPPQERVRRTKVQREVISALRPPRKPSGCAVPRSNLRSNLARHQAQQRVVRAPRSQRPRRARKAARASASAGGGSSDPEPPGRLSAGRAFQPRRFDQKTKRPPKRSGVRMRAPAPDLFGTLLGSVRHWRYE